MARGLRRLAVVLLAATLFSGALASGRAGGRFQVGTDGRFTVRAYAEQVVFRIDGFEITAGADYRLPDSVVTPYTALNYYAETWWLSLEVASEVGPAVPVAFRVAFSAGVIW